jgi:hypothetical protein
VLEPATIDEPLPHVFGGSMATAMVAFRGSLVAFGSVNGGCCDASFSTDTHGVIWGSTDGRVWQMHGAGPELALGVMSAAAASADRIVVVGTRNLASQRQDGSIDYEGAVWTSNDSDAWDLVTDVPVFATVVATATGFVAASAAKAFPELWWSATGNAWRRIAGHEELGFGRIERLLATPIGIVGVGTSINTLAEDQPEINSDPPAAIWRSSDGESWSRVPSTAMLAGAAMHDVAWSDGRLLAVGSGGTQVRAAFWTSTDGDTWDRIEAPSLALVGGVTETRMTRVIGTGHGFAATGTWTTVTDDLEQIGMVVWTTQDGLAWQPFTEPGQVEINDWALTPEGDVAVVGWGCCHNVEQPVPLAWTITSPP